MIGVDTNLLVRFLSTDDPVQHQLAADFVRERSAADPAFVSLVVLVETFWFLRQVKGLSIDTIVGALSSLLMTNDFVFEEHEFLVGALAADDGVRPDVADQVIAHVGRRHGCAYTVTFDRKAARDIPSMTLLA